MPFGQDSTGVVWGDPDNIDECVWQKYTYCAPNQRASRTISPQVNRGRIRVGRNRRFARYFGPIRGGELEPPVDIASVPDRCQADRLFLGAGGPSPLPNKPCIAK